MTHVRFPFPKGWMSTGEYIGDCLIDIIHSIMSPSKKVSWWNNSNNNSDHVVASRCTKETCLSPFHNSIDSGVIIEMWHWQLGSMVTVCQGLVCKFVNRCLQSDTPGTGSRSTVVLLYTCKTSHLLWLGKEQGKGGKQYFVILTSLCLALATFPTLDRSATLPCGGQTVHLSSAKHNPIM